jgi:hypothetical protein
MTFICSLKRLGVFRSLVIAAFDDELYKFAFKMGLSVFLFPSNIDVSLQDHAYGTEGFEKITKLKSAAVLEILCRGYDVTWTDVDIAFFKSPIPALQNPKHVFVLQSNAPWPKEQAANSALRINCGFRSTPIVIEAMSEIVEHASARTR